MKTLKQTSRRFVARCLSKEVKRAKRKNCLVERSEMLAIRSSVCSLLKETVFVRKQADN